MCGCCQSPDIAKRPPPVTVESDEIFAGKTMSKRECAYCGSSGPLTREHLWPQALHARKAKANGEAENCFWLSKIGRSIETEPTIKDVCGLCNNGFLSHLDQHACELFDRHWVHMPVRHESVAFDFDYHTLKRWLLKICFNSARAHNALDAFVFKPLLPYMKSESLEAGRSVQLYAQLTYPEDLPDDLWTDDLPTKPYLFWPDMCRVGHSLFKIYGVGEKLLRTVHIRSYLFMLAFYRPGERRTEFDDFSKEFLGCNPATILLRPSRPSVQLKCDGIGAWQSFSQSRGKLVDGS